MPKIVKGIMTPEERDKRMQGTGFEVPCYMHPRCNEPPKKPKTNKPKK